MLASVRPHRRQAAHQAPLSLGFSRQEHWNGLPFPSPMHESEIAQSYLTLRDPVDCSLPGSSIHGIFQAKVLEWGAIAFSSLNLKNTLLLKNANHHLNLQCVIIFLLAEGLDLVLVAAG